MNPIKAPSHSTAEQWKENQRRRRMLEGDWQQDLTKQIGDMVGRRRASVWGDPDISNNLARSVIRQLSTLYNRPAQPMNEAPGASELMREQLANAGHWQKMQGFSPTIIGQREGLVMCDVVQSPVTGRVQLLTRTTPADHVHVESHPDEPDTPIRVFEYRPRLNERGQWAWTRDVWDISDPAAPFFEIQDEDGVGTPGSMIAGPEYVARWAYADGRPFIPGEWFHAQWTGKLRNGRVGCELFDGSLRSAALWTFWNHLVLDASWPQRYMANGRPAGAASVDGDGTPFVEMDPTAILAVEAVDPALAVILGQFAAGGDPEVIGRAILAYDAQKAKDFDISPGDLQRASGDARSGYALEITNEGKRTAQANYEMSFGRHDAAMMCKIAAMLTRSGVASIPDTGWAVEYAGIPLGLSERQAQTDQLQQLVDMNLISRPRALARIEGIPLSEARQRLEDDQADMARFRA